LGSDEEGGGIGTRVDKEGSEEGEEVASGKGKG